MFPVKKVVSLGRVFFIRYDYENMYKMQGRKRIK